MRSQLRWNRESNGSRDFGVARSRRPSKLSASSPPSTGNRPTSAMAARLVAEHIRALDTVQTAAVLLADLAIVVPLDGPRSIRVNTVAQIADRLRSVAAVVAARDALVHRLYTVSPAAPWIRSLAEAQEIAGAAAAISARVDIDIARAELDALQFAVATRIDAGPSPEGLNLVTALGAADPAELAGAVSALRVRPARSRRISCCSSRCRPHCRQSRRPCSSWSRTPRQTRNGTSSVGRCPRRGRGVARANGSVSSTMGVSSSNSKRSWPPRMPTSPISRRVSLPRVPGATACERMTAVEVRALQTYREHISSIGSGAGKYAETYRSAARSAMREAQSAVPAWVMPLSAGARVDPAGAGQLRRRHRRRGQPGRHHEPVPAVAGAAGDRRRATTSSARPPMSPGRHARRRVRPARCLPARICRSTCGRR